uniref:Rab-GAP TBC domain-containing protein n=1 Tax=Gongylonema pulchrum TaxID=637853 RepID=A0A183DA96_9BILA
LSYKHLKKHRVEPVLYMVEWFMCIFCRTLPWPTVLRVWDMFFCEGVKVLFKVAVVLFRHGLGTNDQLKEFNDFQSIVTRLKNLPEKIMVEEYLIQKVFSLILFLITKYVHSNRPINHSQDFFQTVCVEGPKSVLLVRRSHTSGSYARPCYIPSDVLSKRRKHV